MAAEAAARAKLTSIEARLEAEYEGALAQVRIVADSLQAKSHAYNILQAAYTEALDAWAAGPSDPKKPCPYCGINSRRHQTMSKMFNQVKESGANSKEAMTLKADLARKQTECAGLETRVEDLADQVRQLGLTLETARAASTQNDQHQGILLRDAEERAETATTELHQL